jgi:hypothetical protein
MAGRSACIFRLGFCGFGYWMILLEVFIAMPYDSHHARVPAAYSTSGSGLRFCHMPMRCATVAGGQTNRQE